MGTLSIKIKIADREYKMSIEPAEEDNIRQAVKLLNDKIQIFQKKYQMTDQQDIFSMVAFDTMVEKLKISNTVQHTDNVIEQQVQALERLLNDPL